MNALRSHLIGLIALTTYNSSAAETIVSKMVKDYRNSVVFLRIDKIDEVTGQVTSETATGFIVSKLGHILTSCHSVDKKLRKPSGEIFPTGASEVTVQGSVGSKYAAPEPMTFLQCAGEPIDLALLRFKNTAAQRTPIPTLVQQPNIGEDIGAMGFPFEADFFARSGTLSSLAADDTLLASMVLNPGDSGAPVFDNSLRVVGVVEGGYHDGAGIGVIRPIRHAAFLLMISGENIFSVNASIPTTPAANQPSNANVFAAIKSDALKGFLDGAVAIPKGAEEITVTYPFAQYLSKKTTTDGLSKIDVKTIQAAEGFKVVSARLIVTEGSTENVLHVGPSATGDEVRAATISDTASKVKGVKGFIETVQKKIEK